MAEMTATRALTYGGLPQSPPYGVFLYCGKCGSRYSAARGDYFAMEPSGVVTCWGFGPHRVEHRATPMILAREECRVIAVNP
jgi:hypothetical protein